MNKNTKQIKHLIDCELNRNDVSSERIMEIFNMFEEKNLKYIEYLKRKHEVTNRRISGALKQTINIHGPITKNLIGSATKRIYGNLLINNKKTLFFMIKKIIFKWIRLKR